MGKAANRLYENYNYDLETNGELEVIRKLRDHNCEMIFDVGANVGEYSKAVMQEIPNAKIFAFEPVSSTFNQLEANLSGASVKCFNLGLSDHTGTETFYTGARSGHSTTVKSFHSNPTGSIECQVTKGDTFMADQKISAIDFMKLDAEGAEMKILKGFEKAFQLKRIKVCQFEYGMLNIHTLDLLIDFYKFFEERGYLVGKIYPKYVDFRDYEPKHEDFIGPNYLAVDKDSNDLIRILSDN